MTRFNTGALSPGPVVALDYQGRGTPSWAGEHVERPGQVAIQSDHTRRGYDYACRFEVAPGDYWTPGQGTIRGEVYSTPDAIGSPAQGVEQWYGWSTFFPADFRWPGGWKEFFIYTQWHGTASSGKPTMSFRVTPGAAPRVLLATYGGDPASPHHGLFDLGPLPLGVWVDHRVFVRWGATPGAGAVGVWLNGEQRLRTTRAANLYHGQGAYLKQGIYASATTEQDHIIYHTGTVVGCEFRDAYLR